MSTHTLHQKEIIAVPRSVAWAFFSNPRNLKLITPQSLGLEISTPDLPGEIHAGMMIEYRVSPVAGIRVRWLTEITHFRAGEYFVDEQRVGPYALWHHEHWFRDAAGGGTEVEDRVTYRLPFGWLAAPVHALVVRRQLARIFAFRSAAMQRLFPPGSECRDCHG
jgi:ligand-binding SRPBCC domain-containing protein